MKKIITNCPACNNELVVSMLKCSDCGMELKSEFPISAFDKLQKEDYDFLIAFLKFRGNLKYVQQEFQINYPAAKKRLDHLIRSLGIEAAQTNEQREVIDVFHWNVDKNSSKASEIIKSKLKESGGKADITSFSGKTYKIWAGADGESFCCDMLPPIFTFDVFDVVVDFLKANGGSAKKGSARLAKLGEPGCDRTTIAGAIGYGFFGKKDGDSVFDPGFVIVAVLEWAGIAHNLRGYIQLADTRFAE